ncbi:MAG: molybdenum cofactor guanylyltransferase [Gammaproteobacteria bacterium]|nr:molybdenum cofactor guanylyltransferase [Gammaproteobacteria bacterium]MBU2479324.1 molybdenum cofactor guanylyltransferase [Gammaproteobacteria bacterium]
MSRHTHTNLTVLILAGGQATRMGGDDKGLIDCAGRPMIEHVVDKVAPLTASVLISANRNLERYADYGYPVLRDQRSDYPGPLAGIESGLAACTTDYLWILPCDAPAFSSDLLERLTAACSTAEIPAAVPDDGNYLQATFALLRRETLESLRHFLSSGQRKLQTWLTELPAVCVNCSDHPEWFANINTPDDLERYTLPLSQP